MAGFLQRTMVYLGLKDEDDEYYDDGYADEYYEDEPEMQAERAPRERIVRERAPREPAREHIAPIMTARLPEAKPRVRAVPSETPATPEPGSPLIRPVPASSARVHVVEPKNFNDAQEVGDRLKDRQPVIINLQGIAKDLQRRLIDFSSGITYAVGGSMSRVADQVFLLTPSDVEVSQEEKERLQARGLYRA